MPSQQHHSTPQKPRRPRLQSLPSRSAKSVSTLSSAFYKARSDLSCIPGAIVASAAAGVPPPPSQSRAAPADPSAFAGFCPTAPVQYPGKRCRTSTPDDFARKRPVPSVSRYPRLSPAASQVVFLAFLSSRRRPILLKECLCQTLEFLSRTSQ
jgi:hypothetical protein